MFEILSIEGGIASVDGFYCDGVHAGLKAKGALDVAFIYSDTLCSVEALFTQNRFQAAPLKYFQQENIKQTNFILINAKNANAMTMKEGIDDIKELLNALSKLFPHVHNPIMSSTGVIGVRLPKQKIQSAFEQFDLSSKNSTNASRAIMTTDSFPKEIAFEVILENGEKFTIAAMAKGAGMINPSMATMLCYIVTDANIPDSDMKELLSKANEISFNAISVDGDTSTNDSVFLLANKKSKAYDKDAFFEALKQIMLHLSLEILRDGEGSNKVVAFRVSGAASHSDAVCVSRALSNSLLVKTALFGEDPNWGRIASTVGASGAKCDESTLRIAYDDVLIFENGKSFFDTICEEKAAKVLQKSSFSIYCDLGLGDASFTSYGCDLSYEYVKINADYRT